MAKTLPGSPIVGFYDAVKNDFDEHTRVIDVSRGKFEIKDKTRPYGFVDLGARVWFQKFLDDGVEHEYLMTEGYVWSDIYPEAKRIVTHGNGQSMELTRQKGVWTKDGKGIPEFFIINEAMIAKLCLLGEDIEPCFEGAGIASQFSLDQTFVATMYSMMKELQTALNKGGITQMTDIENAAEDQVTDTATNFTAEGNDSNPTDNEGQEYIKNPEDKKKEPDPAVPPKDAAPAAGETTPTTEEDKKKKKEAAAYTLEEIPEYVELQANYSKLSADLVALQTELEPLRIFKASAEKKEKSALIESFYMLSENDKSDVIANMDTYSLDDIEAKLSIICVRNKVNFNLDEGKETGAPKDPTVYKLDGNDSSDNAPAWIKAVRNTAKQLGQ